jgi:hypothetical protein
MNALGIITKPISANRFSSLVVELLLKVRKVNNESQNMDNLANEIDIYKTKKVKSNPILKSTGHKGSLKKISITEAKKYLSDIKYDTRFNQLELDKETTQLVKLLKRLKNEKFNTSPKHSITSPLSSPMAQALNSKLNRVRVNSESTSKNFMKMSVLLLPPRKPTITFQEERILGKEAFHLLHLGMQHFDQADDLKAIK